MFIFIFILPAQGFKKQCGWAGTNVGAVSVILYSSYFTDFTPLGLVFQILWSRSEDYIKI